MKVAIAFEDCELITRSFNFKEPEGEEIIDFLDSEWQKFEPRLGCIDSGGREGSNRFNQGPLTDKEVVHEFTLVELADICSSTDGVVESANEFLVSIWSGLEEMEKQHGV